MKTEKEEKYVSIRLADGDIKDVMRLLNHAKAENDTLIKSVLVRYCIVEYAKPFTKSRGVFKKRFIPLEKKLIFPGGNADHERVITERNQRIAHGDITALCPTLYYWQERDIFPIGQRTSQLCNDLDILIDKMLGLCDVVLRYLTNELNRFEMKFREQANSNRE